MVTESVVRIPPVVAVKAEPALVTDPVRATVVPGVLLVVAFTTDRVVDTDPVVESGFSGSLWTGSCFVPAEL